ncbi:MAG: Stp1/IreP family PP2C-type Ser/Thr phosphatase [Eubacteriales bacterium]|nr:Stp1/IreP family PP2C-type Ser/Thr phosphatase [Eubacteriales bacterium]
MESYSVTNIGQLRKVNQDFVFASDKAVGRLPNLYIVADGLGGYNAGDRASSYAVEVIQDSIRSAAREKNPVRLLRKAIEAANQAIWEESHTIDKYSGMGTTIVAATVIRKTLYVANVGDSRLYLLPKKEEEQEIRQITRDHSWVEELVRLGRIDPSQRRNHPQKHVITRAVGTEPEVAVDFFEERLRAGERLLLCSDGLTNMIEDEEIASIITKEETLRSAGEQLVKTANKNGGYDNISVLLVRI